LREVFARSAPEGRRTGRERPGRIAGGLTGAGAGVSSPRQHNWRRLSGRNGHAISCDRNSCDVGNAGRLQATAQGAEDSRARAAAAAAGISYSRSSAGAKSRPRRGAEPTAGAEKVDARNSQAANAAGHQDARRPKRRYTLVHRQEIPGRWEAVAPSRRGQPRPRRPETAHRPDAEGPGKVSPHRPLATWRPLVDLSGKFDVGYS